MKKVIFSIVGVFLITLCFGCDFNFGNSEDEFSVISTSFPGYDLARAVVGDTDASIKMLLTPGTESHTYEPTPQDIIDIQNADVFIYVGGDSDSWVDDVLNDLDTSNLTIIKLMDIVEVKEEEIVEGMEEDDHDHDEDEGDHEDDDVEYDEHVWTSPVNAILIVEQINEILSEINPIDSDVYLESSSNYISLLEEVDLEFEKIVSESEKNTIVFGDRFPFRYFVDEYGLIYYAAFPGCSDETEASASTIAFLIDKINEDNLDVVFKIELSSADIANTISEETGASVIEFNAGHNVSQDDFDAGITLVDIFKENAISLEEALN